MSKGECGLFHGTNGKNATLMLMRHKAIEQVVNLIKKTPGSKKKAMAVGAYDKSTGKTIAAFAGKIPRKIHPELLKRAEIIGGIGSKGISKKNTVGVCAEFHVVNQLLLSGSKWSNIKLTPAIRPRTGKKMPYCANCLAMFRDLIDNKGE